LVGAFFLAGFFAAPFFPAFFADLAFFPLPFFAGISLVHFISIHHNKMVSLSVAHKEQTNP